MLNDFTLGQYFPGNSLLHRLDPRMKLTLTVLFIVLVFIPRNWLALGTVVLTVATVVGLSRLPVRLLWRSLRPILLIVAFTAVLQMVYVTQGTVLWQWWIIRVTDAGVKNAVFVAVRIACLVLGSSLLTYTTTPTALTDAIEYLLTPLKAVRVNAHEIAMMMTIALRFIPTLVEETGKIMAAQKARGADLESGGLVRRVRALVPIMIPLFVSSFRRAYDLAMAMECRCYQGGDGRTRMKTLVTASRDWVSLGVFIAVAAGLVLLNVLFGSVLV